jgi:fructose-1,6-bisphosphatase/inositol monophosphatase family enzyme
VADTVPDGTLIASLHEAALDLADEARAVIGAALAAGVRGERKEDGTFVTPADRDVEQRLRARIVERFPDHGVLGEEFPPLHPEADYQWILDPVDGTEELVAGIPTFGSIIGLHHRGRPLLGVLDFPALDFRVHAARGRGCFRDGARLHIAAADDRPLRVALSARANFTRYLDDGVIFDRLTRALPNHRIYRSCLAQALAATGSVDVVVEWHDRLWDLAAVEILITEAGGEYRVVRDQQAGGGRILSAVFGRRDAVARACALID